MPRTPTQRLRWLSSYYDASTPPEGAVAASAEVQPRNGRRRNNGIPQGSTAPPEPDVPPVEPPPEPPPEPEPQPESG
jgi:hypothetical protein